jgi:hypothetical protein
MKMARIETGLIPANHENGEDRNNNNMALG